MGVGMGLDSGLTGASEPLRQAWEALSPENQPRGSEASTSTSAGGTGVKNSPANAGDAGGVGSTPGSGRFPGEGNGNPLQYPCQDNPMDRGV